VIKENPKQGYARSICHQDQGNSFTIIYKRVSTWCNNKRMRPYLFYGLQIYFKECNLENILFLCLFQIFYELCLGTFYFWGYNLYMTFSLFILMLHGVNLTSP
jgi:hypothetical protein